MTIHGAQTWTLQSIDDKYLEGFEMWCWRSIQTISWPDYVRNEVLQRVKRIRISYIPLKKANWTDQILYRNCLLKYVTEGKTGGISDGNTLRKM
jgi:hypothetical protein